MELILILWLSVSLVMGALMMSSGSFSDLWEAGNFAGKLVTVMLAAVLLPGIIAYYIIGFIAELFSLIEDLLFPRKSGYTMKVQYDEETYKALQAKKIYCEHWGQIDIPSSVIVFLCKADWEKALKLFPELESKIRKY